MTITDLAVVRLRASHRGDWLVVQVRTGDGRIGLGEASQSGDDALTMRLLGETVGLAMRGRDPRHIHALLGELGRAVPPGLAGRSALSAIEQACWDLLGQSLGVPIHALWGGALRDRVPCYANVNRALRDRTPEAFARAAAGAVADGFTAVKVAPFDGVTPAAFGPAAYARGLERIAAVRAAIGPATALMVDCHSRFAPAAAPQLARDLEGFDLSWLEEPFRFEDAAEGYPALRALTPVPFAAGEHEADLGRFARLLAAGVRYLMPDVKHCGGLWQALRVAALAEAHGAVLTPHNPSGPVSQAASVHVCAVVPNAGPLEFPWGEVPWRGDLVRPAEHVEGGALPVPSAPGLGATLDAAMAAEHRVD